MSFKFRSCLGQKFLFYLYYLAHALNASEIMGILG